MTDRRLRIAEFTDNYGPGRSGILYAVQQLEGTLLAAGHEVIVVAPKAKGPNPHRDHRNRTEVRLESVRIPAVPARLATGRRGEKALERVAAMQPDLIHVHGLGLVGLMGVALARRTGIPLIVTWHTDFDAYVEHYSALAPVMAGAWRLWRARAGAQSVDIERTIEIAGEAREAGRARADADLLGASTAMLEAATVVTTPSPKTASRVRQWTPDVDLRVIPNGVDPLPVSPSVRVPKISGVRFLYAGRIAPEKGMGILLDAMKIVKRHVPDAELLVVGAWKKDPLLRPRFVRARSKGRVRLTGEVDRSVIGSYYAASDVFVFPSMTDTQALVLHEAAHAGLPLIVCDSELDLVVRDKVNGEFCAPDADALAGAMLRMIDRVGDPEWRARAAEVSRELAGQFTIASQDAAMIDLYEEVADREGVRIPAAPKASLWRRTWATLKALTS